MRSNCQCVTCRSPQIFSVSQLAEIFHYSVFDIHTGCLSQQILLAQCDPEQRYIEVPAHATILIAFCANDFHFVYVSCRFFHISWSDISSVVLRDFSPHILPIWWYLPVVVKSLRCHVRSFEFILTDGSQLETCLCSEQLVSLRL